MTSTRCGSRLWPRRSRAADSETDNPLWPFPLVTAYRAHMVSDFADTNTIADWTFAGHIQAALFLQQFVGNKVMIEESPQA